jgi:hypothetical protein
LLKDRRSANLPKHEPEDHPLAHWITPLAALLALALVPGSASAADKPAPDKAVPDETSLRAADREQSRIVGAGDVAAQQAFMHPNYIINGPANVILRKAQVIQMLGQGGMARTGYERIIEGLQITGDVGITMGRETVAPAAGSQLGQLHGEGVLRRRFTNVYLFEDGRWRFLARQATLVSGPPPAPASAPGPTPDPSAPQP